MPCSCFGSVKAKLQESFTALSAFGLLARAIIDLYSFASVSAVIIYERRVSREQGARMNAKKADAKRHLTKLARKVLVRGYRCIAPSQIGLEIPLSPPSIWAKESARRPRLFRMLMTEVQFLAEDGWDPSFFPPGVFQDKDNEKYKLLKDADRVKYIDEVINRVVLAKDDGEEEDE